MFQSKQVEEPESDSDWDSLPGDEPEPRSSPDVTPRHQPAPPKGSPKAQVPQKRPQIKSHPVTATSETLRSPAANSPVTLEKENPGLPSSHKPSQMYGKPGVTSFIDRSLTATSFADNGLETRLNKELAPQTYDNRLQHHSQEGIKDGSAIELTIKDPKDNPPFIDFQAAPARQDKPKAEWTEKPKNGKVKSSYVLKNKALTQNGDHSWDSESEREEEPPSHGKQELTEMASEKTIRREPKEHKDSIMVALDNEHKALETCYVPVDNKRQIAGYTYHFNHGHNHRFDVNPEWKEPYMKKFADRSEKWLHLFWQEFFSTVRVVTDFAFILVLELLKFVLYYVVLRVVGGLMIVIGDHLLKPCLAILFNSFIQPVFIFTRNILTGLKNVLIPLLDITRDLISQFASLLRAFRLFELNWKPTFEGERKRDVHVL